MVEQAAFWFGVGAMSISAGSVVLAALSLRHKVSSDEIQDIREQLTACRAENVLVLNQLENLRQGFTEMEKRYTLLLVEKDRRKQ
jgi:hypothetical protein